MGTQRTTSTYDRGVKSRASARGTPRDTPGGNPTPTNHASVLSDDLMNALCHYARASWRSRVAKNPKLAAIVEKAKAGDDAALLAFVAAAKMAKGGAR